MTQNFQAKVLEIEDFPAARLRRLVLTSTAQQDLPAYHAGQYALLTFPGYSPRPYSIGNAPGRQTLEFHIRQSGSGASSYATHDLRVGDTIDVSAPFGECIYVRDCERPIIAVAGGSGLACMKAIIEEALADTGRTAPVSLYFGARTLNDLYLDETFRELEHTDPRFHYQPVLSEEQADTFRHGLVGDALLTDFETLAGTRIYGAGPVEMLRHVTEIAVARAADPDLIHTDLHQHTAFQEPDYAR